MLTNQQLSRYRYQIKCLIEKLDKLAFKCAHNDPLIKGTPNLVFRQCGKKTCKCAQSPDNRHGPYQVIQIHRDGKQHQVFLGKNGGEHWMKVVNYQKQIRYLKDLKLCCEKLANMTQEIIGKRTQEDLV